KGSINDEKYNWDEQRRASGDCCSYERDEYSGDWGDSKSTNIAKCDKTSYETQEESLDKSSQNSAITDIRALKVHKEKETINDEKNKANLEEIRNPHISS
ncbi:hypothetical protein, partial [Campylobacter fetus]